MTYANNLDPDEAPQNVGVHLRSKLFDIQIIYQQKKWVETMNFLKILKETNIWRNYPACKELKWPIRRNIGQNIKRYESYSRVVISKRFWVNVPCIGDNERFCIATIRDVLGLLSILRAKSLVSAVATLRQTEAVASVKISKRKKKKQFLSALLVFWKKKKQFLSFNYLCFLFSKSYVWPLVRIVSMRRF